MPLVLQGLSWDGHSSLWRTVHPQLDRAVQYLLHQLCIGVWHDVAAVYVPLPAVSCSVPIGDGGRLRVHAFVGPDLIDVAADAVDVALGHQPPLGGDLWRAAVVLLHGGEEGTQHGPDLGGPALDDFDFDACQAEEQRGLVQVERGHYAVAGLQHQPLALPFDFDGVQQFGGVRIDDHEVPERVLDGQLRDWALCPEVGVLGVPKASDALAIAHHTQADDAPGTASRGVPAEGAVLHDLELEGRLPPVQCESARQQCRQVLLHLYGGVQAFRVAHRVPLRLPAVVLHRGFLDLKPLLPWPCELTGAAPIIEVYLWGLDWGL
mmetsp:Transcript_106647/g.183909  ORF Transcript_106647/g.183909 Transcript_106647/m.183909 type:complete len:321 (+) Transcript_106647:331-1293(+)